MSNRGSLDCSAPFVEGHHYELDSETGCWDWLLFKDIGGYGRASKGPAHRVAYAHSAGEIPSGHEIHHVCRNPSCVNPAHLEAMPRSQHRSMHFREAKSPLTEELVREIREKAHAGVRIIDLAREYPVTRWTIGDIVRGDNWASAPGPTSRPVTFCVVCGKELTGRRDQKYCSNAHRTTWNARKHRARKRAAA